MSLSSFVSDTLNVEKWRNNEIWVSSHLHCDFMYDQCIAEIYNPSAVFVLLIILHSLLLNDEADREKAA